MSKDDLVQSLRRQSKGYHQNSSQYRGVTKHQKGKWEARIGQVVGKKYKYLGLFTSEIDAAVAYDRAAVAAKRTHAQTNFDLSHYMDLLSALQKPSYCCLCAWWCGACACADQRLEERKELAVGGHAQHTVPSHYVPSPHRAQQLLLNCSWQLTSEFSQPTILLD